MMCVLLAGGWIMWDGRALGAARGRGWGGPWWYASRRSWPPHSHRQPWQPARQAKFTSMFDGLRVIQNDPMPLFLSVTILSSVLSLSGREPPSHKLCVRDRASPRSRGLEGTKGGKANGAWRERPVRRERRRRRWRRAASAPAACPAPRRIDHGSGARTLKSYWSAEGLIGARAPSGGTSFKEVRVERGLVPLFWRHYNTQGVAARWRLHDISVHGYVYASHRTEDGHRRPCLLSIPEESPVRCRAPLGIGFMMEGKVG
ncbi:hypothetical protein EVAR_60397_1 [Eumeta japonica]|uniref:Uncharacterized protein n=1 Tax=Eumeta variegata TaxID=151549 RepID=A0A4C1YTQ2_EUMVA|nr:hypothetical protein EVAR_60397_1 [Eumeta japonica]